VDVNSEAPRNRQPGLDRRELPAKSVFGKLLRMSERANTAMLGLTAIPIHHRGWCCPRHVPRPVSGFGEKQDTVQRFPMLKTYQRKFSTSINSLPDCCSWP
jgi:hypothetical protein